MHWRPFEDNRKELMDGAKERKGGVFPVLPERPAPLRDHAPALRHPVSSGQRPFSASSPPLQPQPELHPHRHQADFPSLRPSGAAGASGGGGDDAASGINDPPPYLPQTPPPSFRRNSLGTEPPTNSWVAASGPPLLQGSEGISPPQAMSPEPMVADHEEMHAEHGAVEADYGEVGIPAHVRCASGDAAMGPAGGRAGAPAWEAAQPTAGAVPAVRAGRLVAAAAVRGTRASGEGRHILSRSPRLRAHGTSFANATPRPPLGDSPRLIRVRLQ